MLGKINKRKQLTKYVMVSMIVLPLLIYNLLLYYKHDENMFFQKSLFHILDTNKKELSDFLKNNPKEMKWIEISMFDFTQDGELEIIISQIYVERGMMSPVSKNMVFNSSGEKMIEFIGGYYFNDIDLCKTSEGKEIFLIQDNIHYGAGNDINMYIEIYMMHDKWMHGMKYLNWDVQNEIFVYDNITKEEENGIWAGYEGFLSCFRSRETTSYENPEKYLNSMEYITKFKVTDVGALYYEGEDKYLWRGDDPYTNDSFKRGIEKSFKVRK